MRAEAAVDGNKDHGDVDGNRKNRRNKHKKNHVTTMAAEKIMIRTTPTGPC